MILATAPLLLALVPVQARRPVEPLPKTAERYAVTYDVTDFRLEGSTPTRISKCLEAEGLDPSLIAEIEALLEHDARERELRDLLHTWVPLDPPASLELTEEGLLTAELDAEEHDRLRAFLDVQRSAKALYQLDLVLRSLPRADVPASLTEPASAPRGSILLGTALSDYRRVVEPHPAQDRLLAPTVVAYARQHVSISQLDQEAYVSDYVVTTDLFTGTTTADPIVDVLNEGIRFGARMVPLAERKIGLEVELEISDVLRPVPVFESTVLSNTAPVTIQLPEIVSTRLDTNLCLASPGPFVLNVGLQQDRWLFLEGEVRPLNQLPPGGPEER